jgi:diguanylate cyclase (GGDEF)-like protein
MTKRENEEYKKNLQDMVLSQTYKLNTILHFQSVNYDKTLFSMLNLIDERDTYTAGHSRRVATYAKMIAEHMGLDQKECAKVFQAGILHDIGKIATPDAVLLKPKSLSQIEYTLIKEHEIGLLSHILMIADSFDAMTTNRIYQTKKTAQEAVSELQELKGIKYKKEIVDKAVEVLQEVELENTVNQLPQTKLEQERFAYFYKDGLTGLYNKNYFEFCLFKNRENREYEEIYLISLKNFTGYNQKNGWEEGDAVLKEIADFLLGCKAQKLSFRIFGDDFACLAKDAMDFEKLHTFMRELSKRTRIGYDIKEIPIDRLDVDKLEYILSL